MEVAPWGTVYWTIRHGERLENGNFLKRWWEYRSEPSVKSEGNLAISRSKALKYAYPFTRNSLRRKEGICKETIKIDNGTFLKECGRETQIHHTPPFSFQAWGLKATLAMVECPQGSRFSVVSACSLNLALGTLRRKVGCHFIKIRFQEL